MEKPQAKKILIVEDETSLLKVLSEILREEKFEVFVAADGEQGLALAKKESPDLILLDIVMPKVNGITMMEKVREEGEWGKSVPIIIFTNLSVNHEILEKIAKDEPSFYLVKSDTSLEEVLEKIKERLKV